SGEIYLYKREAENWSAQLELAILKSSDQLPGDGFGFSLDIKGDIVLAGSPYDDVSFSEDGSAYLFNKPISGWVDMTETAKLTSISADHNNNFGSSVSIGEDYVVVGAPREDGGGWGIGAAYIYERPVSGWASATESAKLTASDGDLEFNVGVAVEANGNYVYVGANYKYSSGSVYVFSKTGANWVNSTEIEKITNPGNPARSRFGYSIATRSSQLLLGDSENGGSIEIYETSNGSWTDLEHISQLSQAFETSYWDRFGEAVAIEGNIAVVGASSDDLVNYNAGIAYVFELTNGTWINIARLSVSDGERGDYFGRSVDIKGGLIIVGSPGVDDPLSDLYDVGAVYTYVKPQNGWVDMTETQKITLQDPESRDNFGNSVAIGLDFIVVGQNDKGCLGCSGSVLVYHIEENNNIATVEKIVLEGDEVGFKVKADGDVIVMSKQSGRNGRVFIIEKDENNSWEAPVVTNLYNGSASFGYNIDINGTSIAVGSPLPYTDNGVKSGVYVFTRKTEKWSDLDMDTIVYENPEPDKYYLFGGDVALSSNHLLISADYGSYGDKDSSQVWRVRREGEFWSNQDSIVKLKNDNLDYIEAHFNNSLAVDSNLAFVGSYRADVYKEDDSGIVYFYDLEAPMPSFEEKRYVDDGSYSLRVIFNESVLNIENIGVLSFETTDCTVTSVSKISENEILLQLELANLDSFKIALLPNIVYDTDGNPNYGLLTNILAPLISFEPKDYSNGNSYKVSMFLSESIIDNNNLNFEFFETQNCDITSIIKENNREFTIEVEIIETDSFKIELKPNSLFSENENPNRASKFTDYAIILSTENDSKQTFKYYPNPVLERLLIEFTHSSPRLITIINSLGIKNYEIETDEELVELDFSNYSKGVYIIEVHSPDTSERFKIVNSSH
ncbi:hypothetical protein MNBD_BACTEROID06-1858, partial [hydrothermal vent metagenome]